MGRVWLVLWLLGCSTGANAPPVLPPVESVASSPLHAPLSRQLDGWLTGDRPATLDEDREASFQLLADWMAERLEAGERADLLFVCTHNSRRSHLAQLWAQAAAVQAGLDGVFAYSAGTETTAFNPRAVQALAAHGFQITPTAVLRTEENPVYHVVLGPDLPVIQAFSKELGDAALPERDFAAIMTCSGADGSCPFVEGAALRVSVPYLDPKARDGSPQESQEYLDKSAEIGREMAWLMRRVSERLSD